MVRASVYFAAFHAEYVNYTTADQRNEWLNHLPPETRHASQRFLRLTCMVQVRK
jgi:hypothetical protein